MVTIINLKVEVIERNRNILIRRHFVLFVCLDDNVYITLCLSVSLSLCLSLSPFLYPSRCLSVHLSLTLSNYIHMFLFSISHFFIFLFLVCSMISAVFYSTYLARPKVHQFNVYVPWQLCYLYKMVTQTCKQIFYEKKVHSVDQNQWRRENLIA